MNILLTGASGIVGGAVLRRLLSASKHRLRVSCRRYFNFPASPVIEPLVGLDLGVASSWSQALEGIDVVIHCAAKVQGRGGDDSQAEFRRVNVDGTLRLAHQAAEAGVRRFIFISSIKVNGESTLSGRPFLASDTPCPHDCYAQSKLEAEKGLLKLADEASMEVVIIRPPLVYAHGAKGNFSAMAKFVRSGMPLPLACARNSRSLVSADNLADLVFRCVDHPGAANRVLLASDGADLSTVDLLLEIGKAMDKPVRLIPVPLPIIKFLAVLVGREAMAQRLLGSLQVDISQTCELLDWTPPYTIQEGIKRCFVSQD